MMNSLAMSRSQFSTRRHFLKQAGALGIGSMALSSLLNENLAAEILNPSAPRASPFAQGETRHLPASFGWPTASGSLRLQTRAGQARR